MVKNEGISPPKFSSQIEVQAKLKSRLFHFGYRGFTPLLLSLLQPYACFPLE